MNWCLLDLMAFSVLRDYVFLFGLYLMFLSDFSLKMKIQESYKIVTIWNNE